MIGFEPPTSGDGSDLSTKWATTTACHNLTQLGRHTERPTDIYAILYI